MIVYKVNWTRLVPRIGIFRNKINMPPVKKQKSGILKELNTADNQKKKEDIFARAARGSKITKAKVKHALDLIIINQLTAIPYVQEVLVHLL